jgi:hypothetical protein
MILMSRSIITRPNVIEIEAESIRLAASVLNTEQKYFARSLAISLLPEKTDKMRYPQSAWLLTQRAQRNRETRRKMFKKPLYSYKRLYDASLCVLHALYGSIPSLVPAQSAELYFCTCSKPPSVGIVFFILICIKNHQIL